MNTLTRPSNPALDKGPWYREPWPWLLMAGPATVVVAGVITYALAARTENALVVDNYYKEGLAINQVLDARRNAAAHGYAADVAWSEDGALRVTLAGAGALPGALSLSFVHPTHSGQDRSIALVKSGSGEYVPVSADKTDSLRATPRWYLRLRDGEGSWQLAGEWDLRSAPRARLTPETR